MSFSPYADNGGTCVAIAGEDFAVIGSDTRLSSGYSVLTRKQSKLFKITPRAVLGSTGCWADASTFAKVIGARVTNYLYEHNQTISIDATAQLVSNMLYYKRFFPYYITNVLAGLNDQGKGVIYSYDPVGCMEQNRYISGGSSSPLIQPILDNQELLHKKNPISKEEAVKLVQDVFVSAGERDIYVGDYVHTLILTSSGIEERTSKLRLD